ncbi:MAG: nucleotidyl transferase AbiEii/AbiGii toxin family protein [Armatimonadetes bacterium]|nr:nucleotidyl transferase AbiEii/AbiGii toxin family protein [Armatimonadota bacterium]
MTEQRNPQNVGASVRQRLLNRSRERGEDFGWLLSRYAVERFLYRLAISAYADQFTLKGAQLFVTWVDNPYRMTRDLDLLRWGDPAIPILEGIFCSLCEQTVDVPDGIDYLPDTVRGEAIREATEYGGVRVRVGYRLADAKDSLQIDIGVGDAVVPQVAAYPSLLGLPAPRIRAYPRESVVAEKYHAMVLLGIANSRMKDYLDLHVIAREFAFDGETLARAIAATFERRATTLPIEIPVALTPEFASDTSKRTQWQGFLKRSRLVLPVPDLAEVTSQLQSFLIPPTLAAAGGLPFQASWPAGGPWRDAI